MKETDFIRQNQKKWADLETRLKQKGRAKDFDKLSDNFVQLSEDLSYAQTYYPRRTVRVYLNTIAQRAYKKVFNARQHDKQSRFRFWSHELPTGLWESRYELIIAAAVFSLAVFIGVVSSKYEDGFASQILGSNYTSMTDENIAKGDPMGVYKKMDALEMFFRIFYNNLQVSVFTFVLGILFGIGTIGILMSNGIMLGVFQYFFVQRGLGFLSFLTIWQHGVIEIASIVVAGGAGLVLGRSIVFPGTLPRGVSLKFGMLKGLKVLMGVAPLIFMAAFIESFYTRFDNLPVPIRLATILASLAFVIGYYIVLPIKRGRKQSLLRDVADDYSQSHIEYTLNLDKLKSVGEVLGDSLVIIQRHLAAFMRPALISASVLALAIILFLKEDFAEYLYFGSFRGFILADFAMTIGEVFLRLRMYGDVLGFSVHVWLWPLITVLVTLVAMASGRLIHLAMGKVGEQQKNSLGGISAYLALNAIFLAPFFISLWYVPIYLLFFMPASGLAWSLYKSEGTPVFAAFAQALRMLLAYFLRQTGSVLYTVLFSLLAAMLIQSPVLYLLFELGNGFFGLTNKALVIVEFFILFSSLVTLFCGAQFIMLNSLLNFRSMREIKQANQLMADIENLNIGRR
jgi:uncharacterized membrane protein SpoIIM required for sporulation